MNLISRTTKCNQAILWTAVCFFLCMPLILQAQEFVPTAFIAWRPDGTMMAVGSGTAVQVIDISTMQTLHTLSGLHEQTTEPIWSPDGNKLAIVNYADVEIWQEPWNPSSAQRLVSYKYYANLNPPEPEIGVDAISWSLDGSRIAAVIGEVVDIFNASTGLRLRLITGDWDRIPDIVWNGNDRLAIGNLGNVAVIVNPDTGNIINFFFWDFMQPTYGPGIWAIAFSPDGNQMAMGAGNGEIAIWGDTRTSDYTTYDANIELKGHIDYVFSVDWSPNGQFIASSSRDGTVRIWDVNTGTQLQVIQVGTNTQVNSVAWSPDGTRLAYGKPDGTVEIVPAPASATPTPTATPTETPTPTPTETPTPTATPLPPPLSNGTGLRGQYYNNADLTTPVFFRINSPIDFTYGTSSPDSAAIAVDTFSIRWRGRVEPPYSETYTFYVTHDDGARLWVNGQPIVNNWANQTAAVTDSGTISLTAGLRYDIVLEYYENTGSASVRLEWSSASQTRQVIPKAQLYPPEGQLAFTGRASSNDEIYVANPDGTGEINVSNSTGTDTGSAWSPDGTRVAFVSTRDGNEELYLVNADGTGLRRLTNHTAADNEPAWSPDGTRIAFTSARTGAKDIYLINVTGTGIPTPTRLTNRTYPEYLPKWSPNGLNLVYVGDTGTTTGTDVFLIAANSTAGVGTNISNRGGTDISPFWSPDGSKIAVRAPCGTGCSNDQIWVINTTPPFNKTRLTTQGNNYFQSWSPDGTRILFLSTRDGNAEVYVMNADGSAQTNLTNTTAGESYVVWSADARQVAFARSSDVWLMNADGTNAHNFTNTASRTEYQIVWWQPHQT